jgi:hypothetical protein
MTKTDRQVKLDEATERLTQAVESIVTGDDWQRYLAFAAELHPYSARNVFLLLEQAEARGWDRLGHVAGFKTWQGFGRYVRKGETSLRCSHRVA